MRPKPEKTCLAMQALELLHGLATPQQQTPPAPGPLRLQVPERFGDEAGVRRIPLRRLEELGFVEVEPKNGTLLQGLDQGCVVANP